ncbi:hypothetical protein [Nocardioides sp. InS609-2]|uniref:hypothetical protein n=1 Tax=Nocardioides sp. InS609-2 TaxID=2760705 RepID=UPI0020BF79D6|nr:hypothetical protein [Nocardioides sp. InS609-2]
MQRERLKTPYPWTWEIPAAVTFVVLFGIVVGIQAGRTIANLIVGAGMTWPAADSGPDTGGVAVPSPIGAAFWTSLPRVLTGDAAAGLPTPLPDELAPPWLVWAAVSGIELAFLSLTTWIGVKCYTRWGPVRMRGMASAAEAEKLLGLSRLRRVSALVRPDIYGKRPAPDPGAEDLVPLTITTDRTSEPPSP